MKKTIYLLLVAFLLTLCNCKYFKRKEIKPVETIAIDTVVKDTLPYLGEGIYWLEEIDDKFMIVVGSFQSLEFAKIHAAKYSRLGFNCKVILKPDGFYMVTAKSYDTYDGAHAELKDFRKRIAKKSWVFINDRVFDRASLY